MCVIERERCLCDCECHNEEKHSHCIFFSVQSFKLNRLSDPPSSACWCSSESQGQRAAHCREADCFSFSRGYEMVFNYSPLRCLLEWALKANGILDLVKMYATCTDFKLFFFFTNVTWTDQLVSEMSYKFSGVLIDLLFYDGWKSCSQCFPIWLLFALEAYSPLLLLQV